MCISLVQKLSVIVLHVQSLLQLLLFEGFRKQCHMCSQFPFDADLVLDVLPSESPCGNLNLEFRRQIFKDQILNE